MANWQYRSRALCVIYSLTIPHFRFDYKAIHLWNILHVNCSPKFSHSFFISSNDVLNLMAHKKLLVWCDRLRKVFVIWYQLWNEQIPCNFESITKMWNSKRTKENRHFPVTIHSGARCYPICRSLFSINELCYLIHVCHEAKYLIETSSSSPPPPAIASTFIQTKTMDLLLNGLAASETEHNLLLKWKISTLWSLQPEMIRKLRR